MHPRLPFRTLLVGAALSTAFAAGCSNDVTATGDDDVPGVDG